MRRITIITNAICVVLIAAYSIYLIIMWNHLPDQVPTHFDAEGVANAYGNKGSLLLEPVISLLLFGLFVLVDHFPQAWNYPVQVTEENQGRLYGLGVKMMQQLKITSILLMLDAGMQTIWPAMHLWTILLYILLVLIFVSVIITIVRMVRAR